ncbi:MAG: hypothetical protein HQK81_09510 [Desulfovibrionaceae bacterium]|nr:hypothetical protein [Desulfovibrionaceae bacterium]MBF0514277.1 hypothetical protein [Desulfovibrionaceae bacterium]
MQKRVKSVRIPWELEDLDLPGVIREFEKYSRDLESASILKSQGNAPAAEALLKTRQADLGRKIGHKIWEARVRHAEKIRAQTPD